MDRKMKERPILFSAPMVRALLDGCKTQTRRIYKNRKHPDAGCDIAASELVREPQHVIDRICPYGQPSDRLWVRETHSVVPDSDETAGYSSVLYAADGGEPYGKWKPSIHMFREHSRILLEVTGVRVERLQDISEADAADEGVEYYEPSHTVGLQPCSAHRYAYEDLWREINGSGSWDANPWVWVVEFRRLSAGLDGQAVNESREQ
jgi:hypothetical protein